jgi:protein-S-isoprenylcysteine O-methyltransferase Ste14
MSSPGNLDRIRNETLNKVDRNALWGKILLAVTVVVEWGGLITLAVIVDWSNRTQIVVFVAALFVYLTLGMWTWALAARNRVGEQRILRAIQLLEETVAALDRNGDSPRGS